MKKVLKYVILFNLGLLFIQPVQASDEFITVAGIAGLLYASVYGQYYILLTRMTEIEELQLQKNPDAYKVTDEALTGLIQQEAQKRGLNFSKFSVVKNMSSSMRVKSLFVAGKYVFYVGSEEFSEIDAGGQKAIVQHELNHILYNHTDKAIGIRFISHYIGFLACYGGLSFAANYTANYIEQNSPENSSLASLIRKAQPFVSIGFGIYSGCYLNNKCSPVYSRYCEKQADLAIDDDPVVIKGFITFLQANHDWNVAMFGQEFVKQHPTLVFGDTHPTPLERIAYLKEKLQRCSKKNL